MRCARGGECSNLGLAFKVAKGELGAISTECLRLPDYLRACGENCEIVAVQQHLSPVEIREDLRRCIVEQYRLHHLLRDPKSHDQVLGGNHKGYSRSTLSLLFAARSYRAKDHLGRYLFPCHFFILLFLFCPLGILSNFKYYIIIYIIMQPF